MISPCTRICLLDDARAQCLGCGRTLGEIAGWASLRDEERRTIMAALPARLAALPASSPEERL